MWRELACAASLVLSSEAAAKDLGVRGAVFPVTEPDLFADIAARYAALEASGEAERINDRLRDRALAAAHRPKPVEGLEVTETPRAWRYDPTITLARDIVTPDGHVLGREGDRFNPLDHTPMARVLLFFDGDDPAQRAWAERQAAAPQVSPILVAGPVIDLSKAWGRQVYFDQGGKLIARFGIAHVPARVSRDGDALLVEEVLP